MEDIKKFLDLKIILFLKNKSNKKSLKKFSKKFLSNITCAINNFFFT